MQQLPLAISLENYDSFDNFYLGDNALLFDALRQTLSVDGFRSFYFYSPTVSGKTHLLNAVCQEIGERGQKISYLPLEQCHMFTPDILLGLEAFDMICLDNLNKIAGLNEWEEAIFDLFNRLKEHNHTKLIISASQHPKQIAFKLPDLVSRLLWGQLYPLEELNDDQKIAALQLRSETKGFELPIDVAQFLLKRVDRNMKVLCGLLQKLDSESLSHQRKLTIPFIKEIFHL